MNSGKPQVANPVGAPGFKAQLPDTVLLVSVAAAGFSEQVELYVRDGSRMYLEANWSLKPAALDAKTLSEVASRVGDAMYTWLLRAYGIPQDLPFEAGT